ncbi:MAG: MBL fold metallo-hydrolase [Alphaproteobacteria bacterium]|nr:MBL fold metallo-hydrolase [Alphaproteobacteria bacterium]
MTTLRFLGCGDAFGSGGRFNTCFLIRDGAVGALIDCGASSLIAMRKFGVDPNGIGTILITHLHGDHFGGLPFLLLDAQLVSRRRALLMIAGPPGLEKRLHEAMELFFPGSTGIPRKYDLQVIELEAGARRIFGPVAVTPFLVKHPCGARPFALRVELGGKTVAYTGDTEWVDTLIPAAQGADLLIAEAYFDDKPIRFHLNHATVLANRDRLGAKRIVLTHMSPEMLVREVAFEAAEDGLEIVV